MKLQKMLFCGFLFWSILTSGWAQELAVVYIQGDVKVHKSTEQSKQAKNLIYGPLSWDHVLILKNKASVKILRDNGEICELQKPGSYLISSQKFTMDQEHSIIGKFKEFFVYFFGTQPSSEEKDNHINSIFAVSRGDEEIPYLIYPFSGDISSEEDEIEFDWYHKCDTCNFILQIYDFQSKALVFQSYVKSTHYSLTNPSKYLNSGNKYFWNIQLDKSNFKSTSSSFTIAKIGAFTSSARMIEDELKKNSINLNSPTSTILMVASLLEQNQTNYAFQFAHKAKLRYASNKILVSQLDEILVREIKNSVSNK
ncbi:MAG: hypothetical protein ABIO44_00855 [Saprospiraceae bacterium]